MLLAAIVAIGAALAQENEPGSLGVGMSLGDTTGVSLGYRPTEWNAVAVGAGYDLLDREVSGTVDYLQSVAVIDPNRNVRVPIYIGLGAGLGSGWSPGGGRAPAALGDDDGADLSARVPIGASLLFMNQPMEVFANVIPSLHLLGERAIGERAVDVDGTVGFRYHF